MMQSVSDLGESKHLDVVRQTIGSLAGLNVIDVGCGEGELACALAQQGAHVSGVDPFMQARAWAPQGAGRFRLMQASADAIPLDANSMDLAVFVFSLHHVPAQMLASALAEARRVLRPDGRLYVAEPIAQGPAQYVMELFHDERTVRAAAQAALHSEAEPHFAERRTYLYRDSRNYHAFDEYAQRMVDNIRFNNYTRDDVFAPEVRRRFDEMLTLHNGRFDQPVRVDLFAGKRSN